MHLRRRDAGFTLIELLIAVVIMGVIAVPLGDVVLSWLQHTGATSDRLQLSHDAQISAAYFAQDVAGVGMHNASADPDRNGNLPFEPSIQKDAAYNAGGITCGSATTPAAKVRLISDDWTVTTNAGSVTATLDTDVVAYYLATPAGSTVSELHRLKCVDINSIATVTDDVVAHNVDPSVVVDVRCYDAGAEVDCREHDPAVPQQVTLKFTTTKPSIGAYPIALTGQRRQT